MPADTPEGKFFRRLETLDTTTVIPFLLALLDEIGTIDDKPAFHIVLRDLESFLVRRMICGLTTKAYNHIFTGLLAQIKDKRSLSADTVRTYLLKNSDESNKWPDDLEFKKSWCLTPLYNSLRRDRLRMVLEAVNEASHSERSEKIDLKNKLEVEHLMPRKWEDHWPLPSTETKEEGAKTRDYLVHTIGNLTLLTKKLNASISNGPWSGKRPEILKHSAISLNRHFSDEEMKVWDEKRVIERAGKLFQIATTIWPRPS